MIRTAPDPLRDHFLVCGLGSLGQHCVVHLKKFGVGVSGVDLTSNEIWEIESVPDLLDTLLLGDCRHPAVLDKIGIEKFRAVLFVTSNDRVNIEAALEARLRNPSARLVVRSGKTNFNRLLRSELGNFTALEPRELAASAFALATFGDRMQASFHLEGRLTNVIRHRIHKDDPLIGVRISKLDSAHRRVIEHTRGDNVSDHLFFDWKPETEMQEGDTVVWTETLLPSRQNGSAPESIPFFRKIHRFFRKKIKKIRKNGPAFLRRSYRDRVKRLIVLCHLALLGFLAAGGLLFYFYGPGISLTDAFFATASLLTGGYPDLLGSDFRFELNMTWWLRLFGLGLSVVGTIFVGVLYALMTQALISARLQFFRRTPVPEQRHVAVIGLGAFGKQIIRRLQGLNEKVVGIGTDRRQLEALDAAARLNLQSDNTDEIIEQANLPTAKSVMVVTNDEMENLELALMVRQINSSAEIVVRTYHPRFTENVAMLFPTEHVLSVSVLAAEAFVAAAFGEEVPQLFRLGDQTIIVTEYQIEDGDTLNGLLISDMAYGYRVVPILHVSLAQGSGEWMPSDDSRLAVGDRLFVLATMNGLRRIEQGKLLEKEYMVHLIRARQTLMDHVSFEGANLISRISGCDIGLARKVMAGLPADLPHPVYYRQGLMMVEKLNQSRIDAKVVRCRPL